MRTDEWFEQTLKINAMVLSGGDHMFDKPGMPITCSGRLELLRIVLRAMHGSAIALSLWEVCGLDVGRR